MQELVIDVAVVTSSRHADRSCARRLCTYRVYYLRGRRLTIYNLMHFMTRNVTVNYLSWDPSNHLTARSLKLYLSPTLVY